MKLLTLLICLLCLGAASPPPLPKLPPKKYRVVAPPKVPEVFPDMVQARLERAVAALIVPTSQITVTASTDAHASLRQHMEFGLESSTNMVNWTRIMLAPEPSFTVLVNKPREFYRMEWHWRLLQ